MFKTVNYYYHYDDYKFENISVIVTFKKKNYDIFMHRITTTITEV